MEGEGVHVWLGACVGGFRSGMGGEGNDETEDLANPLQLGKHFNLQFFLEIVTG